MTDPSWDIIKFVAGWTQQALAASESKTQQRLTNVIADAGVIVAGLRRLDREFHRLFVPLLYFDGHWSWERRSAAADEIASFAYNNDVVPRIAGAITKLRLGSADVDKRVVGLASDLISLAEESLGAERDYHTPSTWIESVLYFGAGPDAALRASLPEILELIRTCEGARCAARLQEVVLEALRPLPEPRRFGSSRYRSEDEYPSGMIPPSPVFHAMERAEVIFGALLATAQEGHPSIPVPDWVWQ